MTKEELVSKIAEDTGITKKEAGEALKAFTGRNPQTGDTIQIKASKAPKFKAGKALKDAVN